MAVQFDSTIDWDAWYFVAIRWIVDQWVYFVVALIASMAVVILLKVLSPWLHEIYKSILGYEDLLIDMKRALEDDYEDHWDDPDFCVAFLKYHEKYQELLIVARSDHRGRMQPISRYNRFARVRLG